MTVPRESQIVEYMDEGKEYIASDLAFHFDAPLPQFQKLLRKMRDRGTLAMVIKKGRQHYMLPVTAQAIPSELPGRYIAPWKPLDPNWDNQKAFREGCESIRRY